GRNRNHVAAFTARSTVAKAAASVPGGIRMIALPITISIVGDPLSWAGAMGTCVRGCAASTITGANAELSAGPVTQPPPRHSPPRISAPPEQLLRRQPVPPCNC
ncbi:MAG TPA: hypothetical protein VJS43_10435, partial [Candidatus Acidoferrales bacterium]|nr:hypothetical protein [Candidatus Acidoferrales bacterium]